MCTRGHFSAPVPALVKSEDGPTVPKKLRYDNVIENDPPIVQGHGKPGKVMEFHYFFPGLEKSWTLTPGFGKFIKSHGN